MTRVICPNCHRMLKVPAGHDNVESLCPACGTRFVPAPTSQITQATTIAPPEPFAVLRRKRRRQLAVETDDPDFRYAKRSYVVACLLLLLVIFTARAWTWFQSDDLVNFMVIPFFFVPFIVIWFLSTGSLGLGSEINAIPKMRWLAMSFLVGTILAIGTVVLWSLRYFVTLPRCIGAAVVLTPVFGIVAMLIAIWAFAFFQFLGLASRKIEKVSLPDEVIPQAKDFESQSKP